MELVDASDGATLMESSTATPAGETIGSAALISPVAFIRRTRAEFVRPSLHANVVIPLVEVVALGA